MKTVGLLFYVIGICFCIAGFFGHSGAWVAAALSFFAATMMVVGQRKNKDHKK